MTLTQRRTPSSDPDDIQSDTHTAMPPNTESQPLLNDKDKPAHENRTPHNGKLLVCFLGIFVSYLLFGICLEKITRGKYGDGTDKFKYQQILIFLQCAINAMFAKTALVLKRGTARDFVKDITPMWLYACCAGSYMGAMLASTKALSFVDYPTQVIGKACKPIAVMILGFLWAGKRYSMSKVFCVIMIVAGVAIFMYNPAKAGDGGEGFKFGFGEFLLLVSLTLDGFTGAFQETMRGNKYRTTEHNMMYNMNFWSCAILTVMILATGEWMGFIEFAVKYPTVWGMILLYGICSALGQHFIFYTVVTFGPLTCSVITTTRKFFTVLCSVFLFSNPMTTQKWLATALVFTGLGLDTVYGKKRKK